MNQNPLNQQHAFQDKKNYKTQQSSTSKSKTPADDTTESDDEPDQDVYVLRVEKGNRYRAAILHFVAEIIKDRKSKRLFKLKTANTTGAILLYFSRHNVYLVGFEIVGSGLKYEFGHEEDKHLIRGSAFLGYTGSYRDMGEGFLLNIRTDYWALNELVTKLAEGKGTPDSHNWMNGIKKYLTRAVVFFPESVQFKWVFLTIVRLMELGMRCPNTCVEPWMPKIIHGWEDMSKVAVDRSKIEINATQPPVDKNHLYTLNDVDKALNFWIWATDALVVHCLFKVPIQTLRRKRSLGMWWVSVKLADSIGNEEIVEEEWTSFKKRFHDYDDGFTYK